MNAQQDLLGPRYIFEAVEADAPNSDETEGSITYELYAGEWTSVFEVMGEDCCWDELRSPLTLEHVLRFAVARPDKFTVADIAKAQLAWAKMLGGHKGAGMRRSLKAQLAKHGLVLVES